MRQNQVPFQRTMDEDVLLVGLENQHIWLWGVRDDDDNPMVWERRNDPGSDWTFLSPPRPAALTPSWSRNRSRSFARRAPTRSRRSAERGVPPSAQTSRADHHFRRPSPARVRKYGRRASTRSSSAAGATSSAS